jgi:predicted amidohydrolase
MKLAAIQYKPPKGKPEQARRELLVLVEAAAEQGADLIVCPEMATTGYVWPSPQEIGPFAESPRGPTFQLLAQVARDSGAWIVCGFAERFDHPPEAVGPSGELRQVSSLYNSALVITPEGELATCYRKCMLFMADESWANPGWRRVVVPTHVGRVVPSICMDLNDPEFVQFLADVSPDLIAFCANWVDEGDDVHAYWRQRLQGFTGWFVAANSWGEDGGIQFSGRSAIIAPNGDVVAQAEAEGDEVLVVEVQEVVPGQWNPQGPAEA